MSGNQFFGSFLLRPSLDKPSQVMFMVKFSPTKLNYCYDFVLVVHFLEHPVRVKWSSGIGYVAFPNRKSCFFDNKLEFSGTKLAES